AIVLTTALSFIGNVKGDRNDAAGSAKGAAEAARRQSAELWAYYQTAAGERVSMELARDRIRLDLMKRGITRDDPEAKMDALKLTDYEERVRDFDRQTTHVFALPTIQRSSIRRLRRLHQGGARSPLGPQKHAQHLLTEIVIWS